jgi:hypothetical protein
VIIYLIFGSAVKRKNSFAGFRNDYELFGPGINSRLISNAGMTKIEVGNDRKVCKHY